MENEAILSTEWTLEDYLKKYELPLNVRKSSWYGSFYFKVEHINSAGKAEGKRYRGTALYGDYCCSTQDLFCLYGQNKEKPYPVNTSSLIAHTEKSNNPNSLDLNKAHYIAGETKLFVHRDNTLLPAIFDHFEAKNGRDVIFVVCNGKKSFYAFPSTSYIFPNKDDGYVAIAKANRRNNNTGTSLKNAEALDITKAYKRLPKSHRPSKKHDEEISYEKTYHSSVDDKLIDDLIIQKHSLELGHDELRQAQEDYRQACIDARENDGIWDDHTYISTQNHTDIAQRTIQSATSTISKIEDLRKKPYFARVDCGPSIDDLHTAYIGEQDIPGYVTSWRHPEIGNAYYHSAILQSRNDLVIALKRLIEIEDARFVSFDDEINLFGSSVNKDAQLAETADDLLIKLLKLSRADKSTHDIIRTIQSEQYDIITSNFDQNAVINGCAGSGKTMIMYHRLSYIAYNYEQVTQKKFNPENVYIITPSEYFDISNNSLLKKLSIESVNHAPLVKTAEMLIRKYCAGKEIAPFYCLSSPVSGDGTPSGDFYHRKTFENFFTEVENVRIDPERRASYQTWAIERANELLTKAEFITLPPNYIVHQADGTSRLLYSPVEVLCSPNYYYNFCFSNADEDSKKEKERKERLRNTIMSISMENIRKSLESKKRKLGREKYEARVRKLDKYSRAKLCGVALAVTAKSDSNGSITTDLDGDGFWDLFDSKRKFEKMLTLILVERILNSVFSSFYNEADYLLRCVYVAPQFIASEYLENGNCLLYYLMALAKKYGAIVHDSSFLFIDEFQNYSPFELQCIRGAFEKSVINLYGDFDQQIEDKGSTLREELNSLISPVNYTINVNYRNARQITDYINKAVHKNMHSIGVDGGVTEIDLKNCHFQINNRTAIIAKNIRLAKTALANVNVGLINDISVSGELREGKITLISALDCKGLEFDTVYVLNFGMSENEKYVAYTRALDTLIVISDDLTAVCQQKAVEIATSAEDQYTTEAAILASAINTTKPESKYSAEECVYSKQTKHEAKTDQHCIIEEEMRVSGADVAKSENKFLAGEAADHRLETSTEEIREKVASVIKILSNYMEHIRTLDSSSVARNDFSEICQDKSAKSVASADEQFITEAEAPISVMGLTEAEGPETMITGQPSTSEEIISAQAGTGEQNIHDKERAEAEHSISAMPYTDGEIADVDKKNRNDTSNNTVSVEPPLPTVEQVQSPQLSERERLEEEYKDSVYYDAISKYTSSDVRELEYAVRLLESIGEWKEASLKIIAFKSKMAIMALESEKPMKRAAEYRSRKVCQHCGGKFKGFFIKVCSQCGKKKDY